MRRERNNLTAVAVKNASKPGLYGDGHGLYLQVSSFDTKAWVFRYMIDGRARKMGLGPLHTVSLAEARKRAADARLKVLDAVDPIEEKANRRTQKRVEAAKTITFKECAVKYIEANRARWKNAKHAAQWGTTFSTATAAINDLPVSAVDTGLVLKVLEPIWLTTPETARRIRGRVEAVLDSAKVRGYREGENPARWRAHLDKTLSKRAPAPKHHAAIPYAQMPAFVAELRAKDGITARALEFTILTAARTGEIIGAKWSEIDLQTQVWTIPGNRMKGGKEHRVPLSERALEILNELARNGDRVFPMPKNAMLESMQGAATVHGCRSSFRDWAHETTAYPNELCEIALAHAVGSKVEAAYRRGDAMEKRRRLMADWAAYCSQPAAKSRENVVSIGAGRA
jgi:integrase